MLTKRNIILFFSGLLIVVFSVIVMIGNNNMNDEHNKQLSDVDVARHIATIDAYLSSYQSESNYYSVNKQWQQDGVAIPGHSYTISSTEHSRMSPEDEVIIEVGVAEAGLYEIWLDYYILPESYLNPELYIKVNDSVQFNEMNEIRLALDWETQVSEDGQAYDRYGDELMPKSEMVSSWKSEGLMDPNYFFTEPLKFKFNKGLNAITISISEGHIILGDLTVTNSEPLQPNYKDYRAAAPMQHDASKKLIKIEAEHVAIKSRQSIRSKYVRDPQITPYEYKNRVLNVLDGYSFGDSGDRVEYYFVVEESGFYNLTFKYAQDTNSGMPTHRTIEIDGEVPFQELAQYKFDYSSSWKNETLQDADGNPYDIYLEQGEHTLSLSINNSHIRHIYHELMMTLEAIDSIARDVKRLTGGLVDRKRVWRIERYIPDIKNYLHGIAGKLEEQKLALIEQTKIENLPVISELEIAHKLIMHFAEKPEDLPHYMSRFNEGETSAYARLKKIMPILIYNPMHLDKIYLHNETSLPKPKASFATSMVESTKAFVYSFFNPRYNEAVATDDDTIDVWVNQSRLYVDIMQQMIDENFTPTTGIKVNLTLLPDENKIILSNAASNTPDAALGISHGRPFELALRGIIEDLRSYDGFYELAEQFNPNTFVPFIYDEGVYAIPETQDVKMLFYRKDIMAFLGEQPPQTWEDVVSLVPMLQRYDMNFYTPLGSDKAYKGFDVTTPFIFQFGGTLYDETGSKSVINKEGAYEAFDFMTSLFTVYNVPITTSEFYQNFRNGKSPVGIGDANTYIQLKHAAPELAGQWGVLPIPGIENEQGIIERWDPTYGSTAIIFSDSDKKEKSWQFIEWWASAAIQSDFSYAIQATLGNKFLYLTANIEGFAKSAWPADSKSVILEQWEWIQTIGKVPGDYMVEREISNAWNKVVFERTNPRIAIDQAVKIIDRELDRKLEEFGYVENNQLLKPYIVPTMNNIEKWVRRDGK